MTEPTTTRELDVPLSTGELAALKDRLAVKYDQLRKVQDARHDLRGESRTLQRQLADLMLRIRSGVAPRMVECQWRANPETACMDLVRLDTLAVVDSRPMAPDELREAKQLRLVAEVG